ncbi:MAG: tetratricopeptide repeat protein [Bacteroidales bacterium]|nr:tetratricopeptide repeat protein [Bacteroidales bacterium]
MKKILILTAIVCMTAGAAGQTQFDRLLKAKAFIEAGKPDDAVNLLTEALKVTQESRLYLERAEAFIQTGDYSKAIDDLNNSNLIVPGSGEYQLARIFALKRNIPEALGHLEKHLSSNFKKSEKEILLDPAFSLIENSQEWKLFWKKERYLELEKGISEFEFYIKAGKTDEAREVLTELSGRYRDKDEIKFAEATIKLVSSNYPEAIRIMNELLKSNENNESYLRLLGKAYEGSGNYSGASDIYSRLISMEVPDASLYLMRAESYRRTGELNRALADVEKYIDLYPEDKEGLRLAGKIFSASGDNLRALEYFSRNLQLHPNDPGCYTDRADTYFLSKSWEWAVKDYSMALDLDPGNMNAWLNKGISLINTGKAGDACFDFRKSFSLGNKRAAEYISRYCIK